MARPTNDSSSKPPRITPRNSDIEESIAAAAAKETPWRTLNQLANIPRTPLRRASSAGPLSTHRSNRRTPNARTPAEGLRVTSAKRPVATTPHGRAAQRGLDLRRAGLTPGKERRKSGRQQRETPRDTLRALSRLLAPKTEPIVPTPEGQIATAGRSKALRQEDWDDGPELERPRLSLPLGEDDDDDSLLLPPQSAGLEDENFTVRSVELGRRAHSERPYGRLSRGSLGSVRMSDVFADLHDDEFGDGYDSSVITGAFGDVEAPILGADDEEELRGENTGVLRGLGFDRERHARESDIRPSLGPGDDTETTFVLNIPHRDLSEERADGFDSVLEPIGGDFMDKEGHTAEDGMEEEEEEQEEENEVENEGNGLEDEEDGHSIDNANVAEDMDITEMEQGILPDAYGNTAMLPEIAQAGKRKPKKKKVMMSKHGIKYPSLPSGVVKKLATNFARTGGNSKAKISKEALDAIMQASNWFFEQVSDDLAAYSKHGGRKTIDESDILTLMARQRQTNATTTPFSLAQKYLPRELLQELRMAPPARKQKRSQRLETVDEEEEEEA